jgi:hypothetical protein
MAIIDIVLRTAEDRKPCSMQARQECRNRRALAFKYIATALDLRTQVLATDSRNYDEVVKLGGL